MRIHQIVWEETRGKKIPKGWHIHHLDGNYKNNHPDNLMCVSPMIHWEIHRMQYEKYGNSKDGYAANFIRIKNRLYVPSLFGMKTSKETKIKISEACKGKEPPNKGTKGIFFHSKKTKVKISESKKGIKLTEEHKRKIKNALTGVKRGKYSLEGALNIKKSKQEYKYTTPLGVFYSTRDASKMTSVTRKTISKRCSHSTEWLEWSRELI